MRPRLVAILVVLAFAALAAPPASAAGVTIKNISYNPSSVTITTGETVTWTHDDGTTPHTVTSDTPGQFDSDPSNQCESTHFEGCLDQGTDQTFTHKFTSSGSFAYHCKIHASMHGTVVVNNPPPPPPPPVAPPPVAAAPTATPRRTTAPAAAATPASAAPVATLAIPSPESATPTPTPPATAVAAAPAGKSGPNTAVVVVLTLAAVALVGGVAYAAYSRGARRTR